MGLPVANIQLTLKHLGVEVHQNAITRWAVRYAKLAEWYAKTLGPPRVGERWGAIKKRQSANGGERCTVTR